MIDYYQPKLDLTLLGCGFLGPYHLGAICLLEQIWTTTLKPNDRSRKPYNRICGASCGGLVGALLIAGLKLDYVLELALGLLRQLRLQFKRLFQPNTWLAASNFAFVSGAGGCSSISSDEDGNGDNRLLLGPSCGSFSRIVQQQQQQQQQHRTTWKTQKPTKTKTTATANSSSGSQFERLSDDATIKTTTTTTTTGGNKLALSAASAAAANATNAPQSATVTLRPAAVAAFSPSIASAAKLVGGHHSPIQQQEAVATSLGGLLPPIGQMLEQVLERWLPEDAHLRCSNRLGLSVTKQSWSMENKFVSVFYSREDLIRAICAGCFIPIWSGTWRSPRFRDEYYMDGAYSDNEPKFDDDKCNGDNLVYATISDMKDNNNSNQIDDNNKRNALFHIQRIGLSPFACHVEVAPSDEDLWNLFSWPVIGTYYKCNWRNIMRALHAMMPFSLNVYKQYLISGHKEMKSFILNNNLIKCKKCYLQLERQHQINGTCNSSNIVVRDSCETTSVCETSAKSCLHCLYLLEQVDSLQISEQILRLFDAEE